MRNLWYENFIPNRSFLKDEFARQCEPVQKVDFLYTGKIPKIGQRAEIQIALQTDERWFRLSGFISEILPAPTNEQVGQQDPPSLFFQHGREAIVNHYGAVHGQVIRAVVALNFDFYHRGLPVEKDETFEVTLRCNDNLGAMWEVRSIRPLKFSGKALWERIRSVSGENTEHFVDGFLPPYV